MKFKNKYMDAASFDMPGEAGMALDHEDADQDMLYDK
jgi:hypothetical protein